MAGVVHRNAYMRGRFAHRGGALRLLSAAPETPLRLSCFIFEAGRPSYVISQKHPVAHMLLFFLLLLLLLLLSCV